MNKYKLLILILVLSTSAVSFAWTGPTQSFPNGNNIPVNNGSISQTKVGYVWLPNLVSNGSLWSSSTIAIGTLPNANPASSSLSALIQGKIQATNFCNSTGNDCINNLRLDRPDYVSPWTYVSTKDVFSHNLNSTNTMVYLEARASYRVGYFYSSLYFGGDNLYSGYAWSNKTANTITVNNDIKTGPAREFRVLMWKLDGNKKKVTTRINHVRVYNVPSGAVMYFDSLTCPTGWTLFEQSNSATDFFLRGATSSQPAFGGSNSVVLNQLNIPQHSHNYTRQNYYSAGNEANITVETDNPNSGSNDENRDQIASNVQRFNLAGYINDDTERMSAARPFNIIPPYYTMRFCKKI